MLETVEVARSSIVSKNMTKPNCDDEGGHVGCGANAIRRRPKAADDVFATEDTTDRPQLACCKFVGW